MEVGSSYSLKLLSEADNRVADTHPAVSRKAHSIICKNAYNANYYTYLSSRFIHVRHTHHARLLGDLALALALLLLYHLLLRLHLGLLLLLIHLLLVYLLLVYLLLVYLLFIFLLLLLLGPDQLALLITRNALPTRLEALPTRIEPGERMGLGIKHYLVKWEEVVGAEEEVEVLQRLGLSKSVSNEVSQKGRVEGFSNLPARNSPCCPDSAVGFWSHR